MVVIVTSNVAPRFRGFLTSCMLEIAPGVYTAPHMTMGVRERVWTVLAEWFVELSDGSIVMTWRDPMASAGQGLRSLGLPAKEIVEADGLFLVKREI